MPRILKTRFLETRILCGKGRQCVAGNYVCAHRALSLAAGTPLDAVSGAAWLTPEAAAIILADSREPTAATDLEWPALILRHDPARLRGLRCEGLEWETPDFHAAAIASFANLDAWTTATYDTSAVWAERLALAAASTAALTRVLGR